MCIGIPMQVLTTGEYFAVCAGRGERQRLDVRLIGPAPPDTWVLAFQGTAVRILSAVEAAQTNAALDALDALRSGTGDIDAHFADLVGREPQLPDHLKENR
ncbi:MAG: HypC/HybG/HupF family hydrogenase formation chaperone [Casimicrobiaceae bacterium]